MPAAAPIKFCRQRDHDVLFLRTERLPDGTRTFKLEQGEPLPTSFSQDVYRRVFGEAPHSAVAAQVESRAPTRVSPGT